ncbi:hypothetical protein V1477_019594 [Vespula maculifrons]|uniref:Uncharacterized protein n=1 Tax=Vespula maculifrons TaxID=7453 RepID=A0ABD2AQV8_VESMC
MKLETVVRCGKDKLVADGSHRSGFSFYSSFEGSSMSSTEITAVVWETSRNVSADKIDSDFMIKSENSMDSC